MYESDTRAGTLRFVGRRLGPCRCCGWPHDRPMTDQEQRAAEREGAALELAILRACGCAPLWRRVDHALHELLHPPTYPELAAA